MDFSEIKCVVFDFDGTLVDSNHIKINGFWKICERDTDGKKHMDFILNTATGNRFEIIKAYCKRQNYIHAIYERKVTEYCDYVDGEVIRSNSIKGAENILKLLYNNNYFTYINTATPTSNIKKILKSRNWTQFFNGIYGSPNSKIENLNSIIQNRFKNSEVLVVGDGEDDLLSAKIANCPFLPVGEARGVPKSAKKYDLIYLNKELNREKF